MELKEETRFEIMQKASKKIRKQIFWFCLIFTLGTFILDYFFGTPQAEIFTVGFVLSMILINFFSSLIIDYIDLCVENLKEEFKDKESQ